MGAPADVVSSAALSGSSPTPPKWTTSFRSVSAYSDELLSLIELSPAAYGAVGGDGWVLRSTAAPEPYPEPKVSSGGGPEPEPRGRGRGRRRRAADRSSSQSHTVSQSLWPISEGKGEVVERRKTVILACLTLYHYAT